MNAQQLEYVRIQLRAALVDDSGGTKGQLEAFAENPPADKGRNPRKPVHVVELEDGRKVQAENSALYVLETRSRRRPMPPIRDKAFCSAVWRRAVLKLDVSQQAWVKYCYGFDLNYEHQKEICRFIWVNFEKQLAVENLQKRVKKRLISLVWLAAQDMAAKSNNETYREYAATVLASLMSIERRAWYKTYAAYWQQIKGFAESLDQSCLSDVLKQVQESAEMV